MKKPLNLFAVVLWLLAVVVIVGDAAYLLTPQPAFTPQPTDTYYVVSYWFSARNSLVSAGVLAALGVLIELLDQIRWNTRPPTQ